MQSNRVSKLKTHGYLQQIFFLLKNTQNKMDEDKVQPP